MLYGFLFGERDTTVCQAKFWLVWSKVDDSVFRLITHHDAKIFSISYFLIMILFIYLAGLDLWKNKIASVLTSVPLWRCRLCVTDMKLLATDKKSKRSSYLEAVSVGSLNFELPPMPAKVTQLTSPWLLGLQISPYFIWITFFYGSGKHISLTRYS